MKEFTFIVDVYMICNDTDKVLPMKKNVSVSVNHITGKKNGCVNLIHTKLNEMFYTDKVRPKGFEWTD